MPEYLGIDTSNYTTSTAVFSTNSGICVQSKKLLPVKDGELGLRQSDAVFHHVNQFSDLISNLPKSNVKAVGVSTRPRNTEGSYMPCFLVGKTVAKSISFVGDISCYETSHQVGHILSALYSCDKLSLAFGDKPFIAFHVSGGTTDCLLISPDSEEVFVVEEISSSLDLKAGQAIDRVGLMLGLKFPCGKELENLALKSTAKFKIRPTLKDGNCCLSGVENKCKTMIANGASSCDVALYCIKYIEACIYEMSKFAAVKFPNLPIIYAGGVMSNMIIRKSLINDFEAYFALPEFSCDNACGVAIYAAIKDGYKL